MDKVKQAYDIVLEDIIKNQSPMFIGKYDAKHGKKEFMYGISTVMEMLAYRISEEVGDKFSDMFLDNMINSEKKGDN